MFGEANVNKFIVERFGADLNMYSRASYNCYTYISDSDLNIFQHLETEIKSECVLVFFEHFSYNNILSLTIICTSTTIYTIISTIGRLERLGQIIQILIYIYVALFFDESAICFRSLRPMFAYEFHIRNTLLQCCRDSIVELQLLVGKRKVERARCKKKVGNQGKKSRGWCFIRRFRCLSSVDAETSICHCAPAIIFVFLRFYGHCFFREVVSDITHVVSPI